MSMVPSVTTHCWSWVFCPLGGRRCGEGCLNSQKLPLKSKLPPSELRHIKTPPEATNRTPGGTRRADSNTAMPRGDSNALVGRMEVKVRTFPWQEFKCKDHLNKVNRYCEELPGHFPKLCTTTTNKIFYFTAFTIFNEYGKKGWSCMGLSRRQGFLSCYRVPAWTYWLLVSCVSVYSGIISKT